MVISCSAYGCTNRFVKHSGIHFYRFPLKKPDLLKKWVTAVRRENFKPTKSSSLCSEHFKDTDFKLRPGAFTKKLKEDAVPSMFSAFPSYYQPSEKKPKTAFLHRSETVESSNVQDNSEAILNTSGKSTFPESNVINDGIREESTNETNKNQNVDKIAGSADKTDIEPRTKDQAVQTVACALPVTVQALCKRIKLLQQKVGRRNSRIRNLKRRILCLKDKKLVDSKLEHPLLDQYDLANVSKH
ncbi:THAP domain-containing protein 4-like [Centruroides sculpturatus]|uniref:THAP domain-containing protein 4-like n=1 Tax=Centruroides sculpturatus TaxID=218467 RepID=UPI000C6CAE10|nr:THAP domain-containing protein 4-like [Centruroides sculpturatus]